MGFILPLDSLCRARRRRGAVRLRSSGVTRPLLSPPPSGHRGRFRETFPLAGAALQLRGPGEGRGGGDARREVARSRFSAEQARQSYRLCRSRVMRFILFTTFPSFSTERSSGKNLWGRSFRGSRSQVSVYVRRGNE